MLRWCDPKTGDLILDVVTSIGAYVKSTYSITALCANYTNKIPTLNSLEEIGGTIELIDKRIDKIEGHAGTYLRSMNESNNTLVRYLLHDNISYKKAIKDILEVELNIIPEDNIKSVSQIVTKDLKDKGYKGSMGEMISSWRNDHRIKSNEIVKFATKYLELSKIATNKRVIKLPIEDEIESINEVRNVNWSGYSEYLGNYKGQLTFNVDVPWAGPSFICVLVHEGQPGHHTFYTYWDYLLKHDQLPLEASTYLVNAPSNCVFEGAPETSVSFLGWDDLNEETPEISNKTKSEIILASNIADLQRMLQTNASYFYNVEKASKNEVVHYMTKDGWYSDVEANHTFLYFSNEYNCIYYPSYYYGRWLVKKAYDLFPKEERSTFFELLYKTPHTNSTFIKEVEEKTNTKFEPFKGI